MPYFWMGIKAYDMISGRQLVKSSYYVSKSKALEEFPMLKKERLCGAIVYYDGEYITNLDFTHSLTHSHIHSHSLSLSFPVLPRSAQ